MNKLEGRTLSVLKNFASINPSLLFKPGNIIRTMSPGKTVLAQATIPETVEKQFAIYDLSRFLSVLSLFQEPSITYADTSLSITDGYQKVNYTFADPTMIALPSEKTPNVPEPEIVLTLTNDALSKVQKAMGVLNTPELAVSGRNGVIYLETFDSKNVTSDTFAVDVGATPHTFRMVFKSDNMKLIPGDYNVSISSKGISHFQGSDVEYWIACEASSTFTKGA